MVGVLWSKDYKYKSSSEGVVGGFRPICNQTGAGKYNKWLIWVHFLNRYLCSVCNLGKRGCCLSYWFKTAHRQHGVWRDNNQPQKNNRMPRISKA